MFLSFRIVVPMAASCLLAFSTASAATCLGDLNGDGKVGFEDTQAVISNFGSAGPTDINKDGDTNEGDIAIINAAYGDCGCQADFDSSGAVDFTDLANLLAQFPSSDQFSDAPYNAEYDLSGDGRLTQRDVDALMKAWGPCSNGPTTLEHCAADINKDGAVGMYDLTYVLANFGTSNNRADVTNDGTVDSVDLAVAQQFHVCNGAVPNELAPSGTTADLKLLGRSIKKGIAKQVKNELRTQKKSEKGKKKKGKRGTSSQN